MHVSYYNIESSNRNTLYFNIKTFEMKKICQRCSAEFSCREDRIELCSCRKVSLASGVRDYIKRSYDDCLCPKCLNETNKHFYAFEINPKYMNKSKNR